MSRPVGTASFPSRSALPPHRPSYLLQIRLRRSSLRACGYSLNCFALGIVLPPYLQDDIAILLAVIASINPRNRWKCQGLAPLKTSGEGWFVRGNGVKSHSVASHTLGKSLKKKVPREEKLNLSFAERSHAVSGPQSVDRP